MMDKNIGLLIDADSQTAIRIGELPLSWAIGDRTKELVSLRDLRFGHGVFGELHHIFYIILRNMTKLMRDRIVKDIQHNCLRFFGSGPDLIFYPAESTVLHIMEKEEYFKADKCVALSKALQAFGDYDLRLELSAKQHEIIQSQDTLNILFIDDSSSSGRTEDKAIMAFIRERNIFIQKGSPDKLLSYVILKRGIRYLPADSIQDETQKELPYSKENSLPNWKDIQLLQEYYCAIGPKNMTEMTCPFVTASHLILRAIQSTRHCRSGFPELLHGTYKSIEGIPIDEAENRESLLDETITANLLHLCSLDIARASLRIIRLVINTEYQEDQLAAAIIYTSIYYPDLMCYLSDTHVIKLIRYYSACIINDSDYKSLILIICLSILPLSISVSVSQDLLIALIKNNSPNTASAFLAIVLSGYDLLISTYQTEKEHKFNRDDSLNTDNILEGIFLSRRRDFIIKIRRTLNAFMRVGNGELFNLAELIISDFNSINSDPTSGDVVNISRKLAAFMFEGEHEYFLKNQIEKVNADSYTDVSRSMRNAIQCAREFSNILNYNLDDKFAKYESGINELEIRLNKQFNREDLDKLKGASKNIVSFLKESRYFSHFVQHTTNITEFIRQTKESIIRSFSKSHMPDELFEKLRTSPEINRWLFLAPNATLLKGHILNLFMNPLRHYFGSNELTEPDKHYEEVFKQIQDKHLFPLVYVYFTIDHMFQSLNLVVADRGRRVELATLFDSSTGLGNFRNQINKFGGDVQYVFAESGLLDRKMKTLAPYEMDKVVKEPEYFTNIFITKMPLILEQKA